MLPNDMPLAWLLGPDVASAFCESGVAPNPPFAPAADGVTWVVPRRAAALEAMRVARSVTGSSLPVSPESTESALVTLWLEDGARCLLDLLAARSVGIDGPPIAVGFTLADVVVELASRRWSDLDEVYLVGFGREIQGLERLKFLPDVRDAIALLSGPEVSDEHRSRCFVVAPGVSGARSHRELRTLLGLAEQIPSTSAICCDTSVRTRCTWHVSSHRQTRLPRDPKEVPVDGGAEP